MNAMKGYIYEAAGCVDARVPVRDGKRSAITTTRPVTRPDGRQCEGSALVTPRSRRYPVCGERCVSGCTCGIYQYNYNYMPEWWSSYSEELATTVRPLYGSRRAPTCHCLLAVQFKYFTLIVIQQQSTYHYGLHATCNQLPQWRGAVPIHGFGSDGSQRTCAPPARAPPSRDALVAYATHTPGSSTHRALGRATGTHLFRHSEPPASPAIPLPGC